MKKLLLIYFIILTTIFAKLPIINSTLGEEIDLSIKAQDDFKKAHEIYNLDAYEGNRKITNDEYKFMTSIEEEYKNNFFDLTKENLWEIISESDAIGVQYENRPYKIFASSTLNNDKSYHANNLYDNSIKTAWVEGVKEYGIGEYFEIYLNEYKLYKDYCYSDEYYRESFYPIYAIEIFNGYSKSEKTFKENSRVKKLKVYVNGIPYVILDLKDTNRKQYFHLGENDIFFNGLNPEKKLTDDLVLKFEIMEVYPGTKYKDTCISEIMLKDGGMCFPKSSKVAMSDNTYKNIEDLRAGDKVLSYDDKTKTFFEDEIVSLGYAIHNNYIEYDFGDKKIVATDDHPFLSTKGFVSLSPNSSKKYKGYEDIEKIKIGDILIFNDENRELKNIKILDKKEMGYTITKLKEGNTFIVEDAVVGVEEFNK